jgi:hypothetical protein
MDVKLTVAQLLSLRRSKNVELYSTPGKDPGTIRLIMQSESLNMYADTTSSDPLYTAVQNFVNKPVTFYDNRIYSHSFSQNTGWPATNNSLFQFKPTAPYKWVITSMISRFNRLVKIPPTNALSFKVYLSLDGATPVGEATPPVVTNTYTSMMDFIRKSNTPVIVLPSEIPDACQNMVEISFVYADSNTLKGSPLILRSSLNERIDIYLGNHETIKDMDDNPITDECYVMANSKKCVDF